MSSGRGRGEDESGREEGNGRGKGGGERWETARKAEEGGRKAREGNIQCESRLAESVGGWPDDGLLSDALPVRGLLLLVVLLAMVGLHNGTPEERRSTYAEVRFNDSSEPPEKAPGPRVQDQRVQGRWVRVRFPATGLSRHKDIWVKGRIVVAQVLRVGDRFRGGRLRAVCQSDVC